jgi:hypothetical protein
MTKKYFDFYFNEVSSIIDGTKGNKMIKFFESGCIHILFNTSYCIFMSFSSFFFKNYFNYEIKRE